MGAKSAGRQKGKLEERKQAILTFLENYIAENGYPPTVREIGDAIGVASTSLVSYYLEYLGKNGLIERAPEKSRGIRLASNSRGPAPDYLAAGGEMVAVPFLGYIVASEPIQVEPLAGTETVEISRAFFGKDVANLFALKVKGNSMIDALVHDGDTVILRHQERVENGEMAAVWLDSNAETTLKKVYYEGARVRLQPANPDMQPIYVPANDVRVQGKVVMVIRQLAN
ncbi:MAG TPA: transcriptional repressor LexA [Anaerolineae bacterium]|nr:transcriptional repressor LexA [Anaerolineae bacterium]HQK13355.1 transcriptional repressor LexA [Anaerolineae bacterium]